MAEILLDCTGFIRNVLQCKPHSKDAVLWKALTSKQGLFWRWIMSGNLIQILVPAMETFPPKFPSPWGKFLQRKRSSCPQCSTILTREGPKSWYINTSLCLLFWNDPQFQWAIAISCLLTLLFSHWPFYCHFVGQDGINFFIRCFISVHVSFFETDTAM